MQQLQAASLLAAVLMFSSRASAKTRPPTNMPTSAPLGEVDYACLHQDSWLVNTDGHYNHILLSTTDITTSEYNSTSGKWVVEFPDVPNYDHNFTTSEISALNSRPKASMDFDSGVRIPEFSCCVGSNY
jgi:hypothetical protein